MRYNKEKIRRVLIMILIFIIGFGVGMTIIFIKFTSMLDEYNMNIHNFM